APRVWRRSSWQPAGARSVRLLTGTSGTTGVAGSDGCGTSAVVGALKVFSRIAGHYPPPAPRKRGCGLRSRADPDVVLALPRDPGPRAAVGAAFEHDFPVIVAAALDDVDAVEGPPLASRDGAEPHRRVIPIRSRESHDQTGPGRPGITKRLDDCRP